MMEHLFGVEVLQFNEGADEHTVMTQVEHHGT